MATCATILAILAQAAPGSTVQLTGACGPLELRGSYSRPVTVDASRASVRGLRISGRNIVWKGGTLSAADGLRGKGGNGYAVHISGAGVTVKGAVITDARLGMLIHKAAQVRIESNRFTGLRADGMQIVASTGIVVAGNRFENSRPDPTVCITRAGRTVANTPKRDCDGVWDDGDHPDAVQMRDGVADVVIEKNIVSGNTQGITQMDTTGDAPLSNVVIRANEIATDNYHHITLGACRGCRIENNIVKRAKGSQRKALIRPGQATRCGNQAQDEKLRDAKCR